jgi:hypothetical protein
MLSIPEGESHLPYRVPTDPHPGGIFPAIVVEAVVRIRVYVR